MFSSIIGSIANIYLPLCAKKSTVAVREKNAPMSTSSPKKCRKYVNHEISFFHGMLRQNVKFQCTIIAPGVYEYMKARVITNVKSEVIELKKGTTNVV